HPRDRRCAVLGEVARRVARCASQHSCREIAATLQPLRRRFKLPVGRQPLLRTDERTPTDGEGNGCHQQEKNAGEGKQQYFPEFRHLRFLVLMGGRIQQRLSVMIAASCLCRNLRSGATDLVCARSMSIRMAALAALTLLPPSTSGRRQIVKVG